LEDTHRRPKRAIAGDFRLYKQNTQNYLTTVPTTTVNNDYERCKQQD